MIIIFGGLLKGPAILGNYHVILQVEANSTQKSTPHKFYEDVLDSTWH